jgi:transketolase
LSEIPDVAALRELSRRIRENILTQIYHGGSGHPGGSMSCVEILAVLFGHHIRPGANWIRANARDRVILSKGHAAPALYGAFAEVGLIPKEELKTLRQLGSRLQGHPDRTRLEEVEMSTGSLGQGLSVGVGLAWSLARRGDPHHAFVILGDGEMNSGQVWEAIALAGVQKLERLVAIVDANGIQNDGPVAAVQDIRPYREKLEAFGWAVAEVDGQSVRAVAEAVAWATSDEPGPRPRLIVANTTKGAGVSFMEGRVDWHSHTLTADQYAAALEEVRA